MRDFMLILHFMGLTMSLGAGFANLFLGIAASKLEPAERGTFLSRAMILTRMGHVGLGLLLISGGYLATPFWDLLGDMPLFSAKLVLVLLLIINVSVFSILVKRALREGNPARLMKLRPIGMLNFFLGITVVILAVLAFH